MKVPDLSEEIALAWQAFDQAAESPRVMPAPILFFGDLKAYHCKCISSPLRVLTVGLNPSRKEFPDGEPFKRFPSLDGSRQDRDPDCYGAASLPISRRCPTAVGSALSSRCSTD